MAATVTEVERELLGNKLKLTLAEVTMASYTTGGEAITPGAIHLDTILGAFVVDGDAGVTVALGPNTTGTNLLVAYDSGGTEATATTDLGTLGVVFIGY